MAVHIRLARAGAKKRPFYRIVVADQRAARGGRFLEHIGTFDPRQEPVQFSIDAERLAYWKGNGAQASATVDKLLKSQARAAKAAAAEAAK
jgi:small subunit ribosomal protein S16